MTRPDEREFAKFYAGYVSLVPESDVLPILERQPNELRNLAARVGADSEKFRYAPGKWSIRETLGHMGDTERVFGYRAFCIGRGEQASLPGFDENDYVAAAGFDRRTASELVTEFAAVREANLFVFRRFTASDWDRVGNANGNRISLRAIAFIMAGHLRHHCRILQQRYRVDTPA